MTAPWAIFACIVNLVKVQVDGMVGNLGTHTHRRCQPGAGAVEIMNRNSTRVLTTRVLTVATRTDRARNISERVSAEAHTPADLHFRGGPMSLAKPAINWSHVAGKRQNHTASPLRMQIRLSTSAGHPKGRHVTGTWRRLMSKAGRPEPAGHWFDSDSGALRGGLGLSAEVNDGPGGHEVPVLIV
jgi:hypothetical protein